MNYIDHPENILYQHQLQIDERFPGAKHHFQIVNKKTGAASLPRWATKNGAYRELNRRKQSGENIDGSKPVFVGDGEETNVSDGSRLISHTHFHRRRLK